MRRCSWLLLVLLAWLPAPAADFDLKVGAYFGEPVPLATPGLYAEVQNNTGQAARGRIEVISEDRQVGWAELDLPPGTRRRTDLRLAGYPRSTTDRMEVVLLVDARPVARRTVTSAWFNTPTLVLSPKASLVGLFNAYEAHMNQAGTTRAVVQAPESSRSYQGAVRVILHDGAALALSQAQMQALSAYVREGGELLFVANQDPAEYRGTPLESLYPLRPEGVRLLSDGYSVVTGTVPSGDKVLVKREGSPLLIAGNRGLGRVYLVTAEMLTPSLLGEKTTFALIDRMAQGDSDYSRWQPQELWGISHQERLRFNSIALGLGLYFLAAGPLNFYFLRQRQRRVWALITLPVLALSFSALVLLYNAKTHGFQPRLQQFGLLRLESGQPLGLYESTIFLDSLWEGKFTLDFSAEADLSAATYYPPDDGFALGLVNGRQQLRNLSLNAWSGVALFLVEARPISGPITLDLRVENGVVLGTVHNQSDLTLEDCELYQGGKRTGPFRLPPGDREVHFPLGDRPHSLAPPRGTLRSSVGLGGKALYMTGFLPRSLDPVTSSQVDRRGDLTLVAVRKR